MPETAVDVGVTLLAPACASLTHSLQGKQQAEQELFRCYPDSGVALRPWIIYGDRALRCDSGFRVRGLEGGSGFCALVRALRSGAAGHLAAQAVPSGCFGFLAHMSLEPPAGVLLTQGTRRLISNQAGSS